MKQQGYGFGGAHGGTARERTQVRGPDEWDERDWPARKEIRGGSIAEHLRTIACPGCWCGLPNGHTWPGKAKGAPHPR